MMKFTRPKQAHSRFMETPNGFTLVELVVALAIFSFMMLILTSGVLALFRIYEAGINIRIVQKNVRLATQSFGADVHTARGFQVHNATQTISGTGGFHQDQICFFRVINGLVGDGSVYYTTGASPNFQLHRKSFKNLPLSVCEHVTVAGVTAGASFLTDDVALTDGDVSIMEFVSITSADPSAISARITVVPINAIANYIVSPTPGNIKCNQNAPGSQYCTVSNIIVGGNTHKEQID